MSIVAPDLRAWKEEVAAARLALGEGRLGADEYLGLVDRIVTTLGSRAGWERNGGALVALGGYGRGELSPRSDIDLLFLVARSETEAGAVEAVLYPLWDLGFDVGHGLRTPRECGRLAREDLTVATALLDGRLLLGAPRLLEEARRRAGAGSWGGRVRGRWAAELLAAVELRRVRFGEVSHLLEPHIKEGRGGLRDYQAARWLAACLGAEEAARCRSALAEGRDGYEFLLRVRSALHAAAGRKTDHLTFDFHRQVAACVAPDEALDDFFAGLHRASHAVLSAWEEVAAAAQTGRSHRAFRRAVPGAVGPGRLEDALVEWMAGQTALPPPLRAALARGDRDEVSGAAAGALRRALARRIPMAPLLRELHHLGQVALVVPEVEAVAHQVHYDVRHAFTTGVHSLEALAAFEDLWLGFREREEPHLTRLAGAAPNPRAVRIAALCHDLGKADAPGPGREHARVGAGIARTVARRLGLSEEDAEAAACLVARHHDLPDLAFGSDLESPAAWAAAREAAAPPASLEGLAALAYADLVATNPRAGSGSWSEWRRDLLLTLYARGSDGTEPRRPAAEPGVPPKEAAQVPPDLLRRLLGMAGHLGDRPALWEVDVRAGGAVEILGVAQATPRLLSSVTGALAALRFDILSFQVHAWNDGTAHLWFRATNPAPPPSQEVARRLSAALAGDTPTQRPRGVSLRDPRDEAVPVAVRVGLRPGDDPYHSVLELRCRDRPGLIRDLARVFERFGLAVPYALVTTAGPVAQDVFHLRDLLGGRVEGYEKTRALLDAVTEVARHAENDYTPNVPGRRGAPAQTAAEEVLP